jgi:hypothetical protein
MTSANEQAYGGSRWTNSSFGPRPWGGPGGGPWQHFWGGGPFQHWPVPPRVALIPLMVLGFIFWWPIGLALLALLIWAKRSGCAYRWQGGWHDGGWTGWKSWAGGAPPSSGNRAFDEYRAETLRRLEDEQKEFGAFLDRLRFAKDKAEFDQFMTERRNHPESPPSEPPQN